MTQIIYFFNGRLPTEKAYGYQIAKMCEAFSESGSNVTLIAPRRSNSIKEDLFSYYGVKHDFEVKHLSGYDWSRKQKYLGKWFFFMNAFSFFWKCIFIKSDKSAIIYTRNPELAWLFSTRGFKTVFECHQMPNKKSLLFGFFIKPVSNIVTITNGLKHDMIKRYGLPANKIIVAPDGVDLDTFDIAMTRDQARVELGLPRDKKIALYTGHLYPWKGVDTLAQASRILPSDFQIYTVGGDESEIHEFNQRNLGHDVVNLKSTSRDRIAIFLKAADLLLLPNSAKEAISEKYTSPLKLFEYMSSGTPIIASELPSIREILDDTTANFFLPDDATSLAATIEKSINEPDEPIAHAQRAKEMAHDYTWDKRAKNILNTIQK